MSQPQIYGPDEQDPLSHPLTNVEQLVELFFNVERKKEDWLMGVEYEMFGQVNHGATPIPYEGSVSITKLFLHLAQKSKYSLDPFIAVFEENHVVALDCKRAIIALEPGGQIEIAARPHHHLSQVTDVFTDVMHEINDGALDLGIDLFAMGIHPLASRKDMASVKKARYAIMRNYMGELNGLGLDMMTRSCAIQINLDFASESDMVEKTRLGAALMPFYSLLCASTAFVDGKPCSHAVERGHVWRETDPDRTGIPAIIFDDDFGYSSWITMVLDVPMYFIRRDDIYHDVAGASFRHFMTHGLKGYRATLRDFVDHMSTVFTEVRLKPILELRSPDSLPLPFANAIIALTWALFYDDNAKSRAQEIFSDLTHQEITEFRSAVIDVGRQAQFRGQKVFAVAKKLLAIAQDALDPLSIQTKNPLQKDLLKPLINLVDQNTTCAEWIRQHYPKLDNSNVHSLIKNFSLFNNPLV